MPAINYNFVIEQGSEFNLQFQYNDANNNPVDLSSNYCAVMQILPNNLPVNSGIYFSSSANAVYSIDDWQLTIDNLGIIDFKLGSKYTNTITYDNALYDLDLIASDPNKNLRLSFGIITIEKRQTIYPECSASSSNPNNGNNNNNDNNLENYDLLPVPLNGDMCSTFSCLDADLYSVRYIGSGLIFNDNIVSGYIETNDSRLIENVELSITNLNHTNPQDLQFLLVPPVGDKILLSANQKITNYNSNFSFAFSNKAIPGDYLHNITNNKMCNIYNKTSIVKYDSDNLLSSFDHLFGSVVNGRWHLIVRDTDPLGSGSISEWKLIVTYVPDEI